MTHLTDLDHFQLTWVQIPFVFVAFLSLFSKLVFTFHCISLDMCGRDTSQTVLTTPLTILLRLIWLCTENIAGTQSCVRWKDELIVTLFRNNWSWIIKWSWMIKWFSHWVTVLLNDPTTNSGYQVAKWFCHSLGMIQVSVTKWPTDKEISDTGDTDTLGSIYLD